MDAIEPIDLIISNEIGRIEQKYEIADKMNVWDYRAESIRLICGVSKEVASKFRSIRVIQKNIEEKEKVMDESIAELIKEIENEKLKTQIYIRIAYILFKSGSTEEEVEETTRLKSRTICEIKDLVKPEEIKYDPEKIERFKEAKEIVEEALNNKSD